MKKIYQKPEIQTVKLNMELPMAASLYLNISEETAGGSNALSNREGNLNIWGENQGLW